MAALLNIVASSLTAAAATYDVDMNPATITGGGAWTLVAAGAAAPATIIDATMRAGSLKIVDLVISPPLSSGETYTGDAPGALTAAGGAVAPTSDAFVAPANNTALGAEWQHGLLRAVTRALGQELQNLAGRPRTILVRDLEPANTIAFVETTLAFPATGALYCGGRRYTYTGTTPASFTGLVAAITDGQAIATGTEVDCDAAAILPS